MKWFVVLLSIVALLVAWFYFDPGSRQQWLAGTPLAPEPVITTVYKWRDDNGEWQLTDKPPAAGVGYERLQYHSDTNVMPLVPRSEED